MCSKVWKEKASETVCIGLATCPLQFKDGSHTPELDRKYEHITYKLLYLQSKIVGIEKTI